MTVTIHDDTRNQSTIYFVLHSPLSSWQLRQILANGEARRNEREPTVLDAGLLCMNEQTPGVPVHLNNTRCGQWLEQDLRAWDQVRMIHQQLSESEGASLHRFNR